MSLIIGLDISSRSVRVAVLENDRQRPTIRHCYSLSLQGDIMKDGVIAKPAVLAKLVADSFRQKGIHPESVSACVRAPHALMRLIRLPYMSKTEYRFAIEKEAGQYTIFQNKETVIDLAPIEEITEEGVRKSNVLFAVVPKDIPESYSSFAHAMRVELTDIDMRALAIMRSLSQTNLKIPFTQTAMLAILDEESIDIMTLKGNKLRFIHAAKLDLSEFKQKPWEFLDKITSALRLSLSFYQEKFAGGEEISKIVIATLCVEYAGLYSKLHERFSDISMEAAAGIEGVLAIPKGLSGDDLERMNTIYLGAIGAALHDVEAISFPTRLNLISYDYMRRMTIARHIALAGISLAVIALVMLLLSGVVYLKASKTDKRIDAIEQALKAPNAAFAKVVSLRKMIRISENDLLRASGAISRVDITPWHLIIADTLASVPSGSRVLSLSLMRSGEMVIIGEALNEEAMYKYIKQLRDLRHFSKVELSSSKSAKLDQLETVRFTVNCYTAKKNK